MNAQNLIKRALQGPTEAKMMTKHKRLINNRVQNFNHKRISTKIVMIIIITVLASCGSDYYPKPQGYMRIALPEKQYVKFDTTYPFTFEYPAYSRFIPDTDVNAEPYWFNIDFPQFKGQLNVSYKTVNNNVIKYLEDTRTLVMKHIPKATAIESKQFVDKKNHIYGLTYTISGTEAASPFQFYLTDSTKNFVRGALYFNTIPNNDSLAPVIDFLKQDIVHLIETFRWKNE